MKSELKLQCLTHLSLDRYARKLKSILSSITMFPLLIAMGSSSCGACKFLRRRCTTECVFAPYFCYDQAALHFAAVHKVFGASNVSKLLLHLPVHSRSDAAISVSYQALARMQDPIYGCVAHIFALQQQVANLQQEIENQLAGLIPGISSCKEPQSDKYVEQFPFQHDVMDIYHHQNHSIVPPRSNTGHANGNQAFDDIYPEVQHPSTWEDLNAICNSVSNLETLLQGVDLYGSIHEN